MAVAVNHKEQASFKEFLAKLARSDCAHDFGHYFQAGGYNGVAINEGLAGDLADTAHFNEHMTLYNVLIDAELKTTDIARDNALVSYLDGFTEGGASLNVGYRINYQPGAANRVGLHTYTCKKVNQATYQGNALLQKLGIEGGTYFIIDFSQYHFLDQLKQGGAAGGPINIITNQQTMNDAGPKTKFNDPIFRQATGAPMNSLIDVTNIPAIYTPWVGTNQDPTNFFMTGYTLEISPLKEVKNMLGKRKYVTNMTVTSGAKKTEIKDTKIKNSKEQIWDTIKNLFVGFAGGNNFRVNEGFQRKRLGDWGQALSCLTLSGRLYSKNGTDQAAAITIDKASVWYLTHDWIAAAYALLMGINVLLFARDRTFAFRNTAYGNIVVEQYMKNEITSLPPASNLNLVNLQEYAQRRAEAIATHQELITDAITALNEVAVEDPKILAEELKKLCLKPLLYAIQYQFFIQLSPDVTELLVGYPTQAGVTAYNAQTEGGKKAIKKAYETYKKSLAITELYTGEFPARLIKSIKLKDVYISCEKWTYTKDTQPRLGIFGGSPARGAGEDKYAFLPYLTTMDERTKGEIVTAFTGLLTKLEGTEANQLIRGAPANRPYQHALLTFKILCEHVRLFLTEKPANEPGKFNVLKEGLLPREPGVSSNNHLHITKIVEENEAANAEDGRNADAADDAAGAAAAVADGDFEGGEAALVGGGKQKGGFRMAGTQVAVVDSIKEITWPLFSAHVQSSVPPQAEAVEGQQEDPNEIIQANQGGGGTGNDTTCLAIYIVLEGLRDAVGELRWHPDYKYYVNYYLLLESMVDSMALKDTTVKPKLKVALQEILLTFITTPTGRDIIAELFTQLGEDYKIFPLITTGISYHVCGSFIDYDEEKPELMEASTQLLEDQDVRSYIEEVIENFKTKSKDDFYVEVQNTFSECNYNLKEFLNRVNTLQEKIGKQIQGKTIQSIYTLKRGTARTNKKIRNNTLKSIGKKIKNMLQRGLTPSTSQPGVADFEEMPRFEEIPTFVESVRGGRRKTNRRHKSKKRSSYKHKTAKKH
jgi:hypothetical protein